MGLPPPGEPGSAELAPQRAEQALDVGKARVLAHQSDAPDAAGERAETAADLDAVLLEQLPAQPRPARGRDALGETQRREHRKPVRLVDERLEAEGGEALEQRRG